MVWLGWQELPKSITLIPIFPASLIIIFSGLRSQWMICTYGKLSKLRAIKIYQAKTRTYDKANPLKFVPLIT